jgi:hypothetical protein
MTARPWVVATMMVLAALPLAGAADPDRAQEPSCGSVAPVTVACAVDGLTWDDDLAFALDRDHFVGKLEAKATFRGPFGISMSEGVRCTAPDLPAPLAGALPSSCTSFRSPPWARIPKGFPVLLECRAEARHLASAAGQHLWAGPVGPWACALEPEP